MSFIFVSGNFLNAENKELKKTNITATASCLMIAYNQMEDIEGTWKIKFPIEQWSKMYNTLFESCNNTQNGKKTRYL